MQTTKNHIEILWNKFLSDEATKAELETLFEYIETASNDDSNLDFIKDGFSKEEIHLKGFSGMDDDQKVNLLRNLQVINSANISRPTHRIHFLKTAWFRYAAAILLFVGVGAYLFFNQVDRNGVVQNVNPHPVNTDVAPGGNKAVLTLADGTTIILDSAANGQLAVQQGSKVVKKDGQIIYDPENISARNVVYNTMSTPRGGQYKLTLPDGTRVWLNAATSITYPIAFVGKERKVKITGEAYFEVTKNKEKPFIVDIDGKSSVEVLGTSFNINSYTDESTIKTTLLEGSVKVTNAHHSAILKPGQQANQPVQTLESILIINNANIDQALAWKNGLFNFNGLDLRALMRQLERWYDIKVKYENSASKVIFKGEMYRNVNLSDVLEMLQEMGVKFRLEGKTLIVL